MKWFNFAGATFCAALVATTQSQGVLSERLSSSENTYVSSEHEDNLSVFNNLLSELDEIDQILNINQDHPVDSDKDHDDYARFLSDDELEELYMSQYGENPVDDDDDPDESIGDFSGEMTDPGLDPAPTTGDVSKADEWDKKEAHDLTSEEASLEKRVDKEEGDDDQEIDDEEAKAEAKDDQEYKEELAEEDQEEHMEEGEIVQEYKQHKLSLSEEKKALAKAKLKAKMRKLLDKKKWIDRKRKAKAWAKKKKMRVKRKALLAKKKLKLKLKKLQAKLKLVYGKMKRGWGKKRKRRPPGDIILSNDDDFMFEEFLY